MKEEGGGGGEEEEDQGSANGWQTKSPEIVEIDEEDEENNIRHGGGGGRGRGRKDVYVAVGKNDIHVVKWALDHLVYHGTQLFLVHVFPPITYISTTVGILSSSQLSNNQMQVYKSEEHNRRKCLLEKYIRLCNDAKVHVDTLLVESNTTAKSILELIRVLNITNIVMGTKRYLITRQIMKGKGKGEYVKKKAPEFCEVILVQKGKKKSNYQLQQQLQGTEFFHSPIASKAKNEDTSKHIQRSLFECMCFSSKFNN